MLFWALPRMELSFLARLATRSNVAVKDKQVIAAIFYFFSLPPPSTRAFSFHLRLIALGGSEREERKKRD